jgi:hypothetical protein
LTYKQSIGTFDFTNGEVQSVSETNGVVFVDDKILEAAVEYDISLVDADKFVLRGELKTVGETSAKDKKKAIKDIFDAKSTVTYEDAEVVTDDSNQVDVLVAKLKWVHKTGKPTENRIGFEITLVEKKTH